MKSGTIIEGPVESISFGGDGVIRHEGKVIFVPFVAPSDVVKVKITRDKKSFAKASLLEILKKSPDRVSPPCSYFGRCGGCQLQHLTYESQSYVKHRFVLDALT